ncbi:MAG: SGNH/GDSL hydrolase family protein [Pseudomonadota bacterium]
MSRLTRTVFWTLPPALLLGAAYCTAQRIRRCVRRIRTHPPVQTQPDHPARRLLIVGDSTAAGTGASRPEASLAGLIARHHPHVAICNRARNGAKLADIAEQLRDPAHFDVVLILGGANDVLRMTAAAPLRASLERVLSLARQRADTVILMPAGNVGNTPLFLPPFSWLMARRSRQLHSLVRRATAATDIVYVNGYAERSEDPFVKDAQRLNAEDGLHPSDEGYLLWYAALQRQAQLSQRLAG